MSLTESVWDYPRPPRVELSGRHVEVVFGGVTIASSRRAHRVLETSHPPVYYIPRSDIQAKHVEPASGSSFCEWKGRARYLSVVAGKARAERAAWFYPKPNPPFAAIANAVAFYPSRMDACLLDGEPVEAQPGDFYGGWITSEVVGPFKGSPGTLGW